VNHGSIMVILFMTNAPSVAVAVLHPVEVV